MKIKTFKDTKACLNGEKIGVLINSESLQKDCQNIAENNP